MIFLLLFLVIILIIVKYNNISPYALSPDIIVWGVFAFSLIVACLNYSFWGDISTLTFFVILLSLVCFSLGALIARRKNGKQRYQFEPAQNICISKKVTTLISLFMLLVTYLDYQDTVKIAGENGLPFFALIALARNNLYLEDTSMNHSVILYHGLYMSKAISLIYVYVILYQKTIIKKRISYLVFVPIILYIVQAFLSTGRTDFIYLIYSVLIVFYMLAKSKQKWIPKHEFYFFKYIYGGVLLFLALFFFLANVRSEGESILALSIRNYVGSSIMAYDWYLNHYGIYPTATYWGEQTQLLYYSIARALGISNFSGVTVLPECYISGEMTNIYTCLYRYTHDYGIFIMFFILFCLGYVYTRFFYKIRNNCSTGMILIYYAFLSTPLVEFSIDERFFSTLISARTLFVCFYIFIFYKLLFNLKTTFVRA